MLENELVFREKSHKQQQKSTNNPRQLRNMCIAYACGVMMMIWCTHLWGEKGYRLQTTIAPYPMTATASATATAMVTL